MREDIPKTAIITPFGLFEFPVMSFGLQNAAQTFQRFIDEVTRGLDFCYTDDLVASASEEEHMAQLEILFQRLQVVINSRKCHFGMPEVKFLGYLVSSESTYPLPEKVEAIRGYSKPETIKNLRRFLGALNFYRRFLPRDAETQAPLNDFLQGNQKGKHPVPWTPESIEVFEKCKEALVQATLLAHPMCDAPLSIISEASETTASASLHQLVDGNWESLAFFSKKFGAMKYFWHRGQDICHIYGPQAHHLRLPPEKLISIRQDNSETWFSQFTTDIRHVAGKDNIATSALSTVETILP